MKTYDQIIGDLLTNLHELKEYVERYDPTDVYLVEDIISKVDGFDEYMSYTNHEIAGVDFSESLDKLKSLGKISVSHLTLIK